MIGAVGLVVILVAIVVGSIVERRRVETEEALVRLASSVARTDEMKQFVEAVISIDVEPFLAAIREVKRTLEVFDRVQARSVEKAIEQIGRGFWHYGDAIVYGHTPTRAADDDPFAEWLDVGGEAGSA